ncbi:amidase family protein [Sphingomonas sp.]|uniref:amidase family protein n=1 Tax=Sphingomonas sp. TaxID=28214 RepID=UPI001D561A03|nr:amidase family protein [Sphingomonas sp.]MBX9797632.1 amidase [Sphingomonas sp.]
MRTALATAAAIRAGETTALAECDAAIARIEAGDGAINAVVVRDFDRAREAARAADARVSAGELSGNLAGVPMTVKEAFDVAGLPTCWGVAGFADPVAVADATVVARLKAAGAIILGKTNVAPFLTDWQSDNPVYGRTRHPADPARTPGGSSGGSAAALAAGFVPLELGSDIGGSIRLPAHFCGVWGHKPSWGIVPQHGHVLPGQDIADQPLNVIGPLARDADDLAAVLPLLADAPLAPAALPAPTALRVLMLTGHPAAPTASAVRAGVERAGAALERLGARVDTQSALLPDLAAQHASYVKMLAITFARGAAAASGRMATAADWFALMDEQARATRAWGRLFAHYHAVIAPPDIVTAFAHDSAPFNGRTLAVDGATTAYDNQLAWPGVATFPGLPATCFPVANADDPLPTGVQLITNRLTDLSAIALAKLVHGALQ